MKEATGELNMTVITVVAIAAIAALFYAFIWPMIQRNIVQQTCNAFGNTADGKTYQATKISADQLRQLGSTSTVTSSSEKTSNWACCPDGQFDASKCMAAD